MGINGIGIATLITYSFNFIMIHVICSVLRELKESFFFPLREKEAW